MYDTEMPEDTPCLDTFFHDVEATATRSSPRESDWFRFVRQVKKIAGLTSLDGDEVDGADGYSLDGAYDAWFNDVTPEEYAAEIPLRRAKQRAALAA